MPQITFATAINCMDGRVQDPVMKWVREKCQVDYVDMITEPGPMKLLAERVYLTRIDEVRRKVEISTRVHGSRHIALAGHHDCAGNPVGFDDKVHEIRKAVDLVASWDPGARVMGLYVNENWEVEEIL